MTLRKGGRITVRLPVRRSCRMSPTITANGVISILSRLTSSMCLTHFHLPFPAVTIRWHETGCNALREPSVQRASDTMRTMRSWVLLLVAACAFGAPAMAQEAASDDYEFILAKLAAQDSRYDEALSRIDKVIAHNPDNSVLEFERAMILIDASRLDAAEASLKKVTTLRPDFYDAQRVYGRLLLDRAGTDHAKIDEALTHLQAAYKLNPDDIGTGM